jgi:hypothetical protein
MTTPVVMPSGRDPSLPAGVQARRDQLVRELLAKDPNERPKTMEDVEQRIRDVMESMNLPLRTIKKRASTSGPEKAITDHKRYEVTPIKRPTPPSDRGPRRTPPPDRPVGRRNTPVAGTEAVARVKLATRSDVAVQAEAAKVATRAPIRTPKSSSEGGEPRLATPSAESRPIDKRVGRTSAQVPAIVEVDPQRETRQERASSHDERTAKRAESPPLEKLENDPVPAPPSSHELVVTLRPATRSMAPTPVPIAESEPEPEVTAPPPPRRAKRFPTALLAIAGAAAIVIGVIGWIALKNGGGGDQVPQASIAPVQTPAPQPPPPQTPPEPKEVKIKFVSAPPGATVRIAGTHEDVCTTPCAKTFPRGKLAIAFELSKDGFTTATATTNLANDDAIAISLNPAPVAVSPVAKPATPTKPDPNPATGATVDRNGTMDVFPTK